MGRKHRNHTAEDQLHSKQTYTKYPKTATEARSLKDLDGIDAVLDEMASDMDQSYMNAGKTLAELFRTVCEAAVSLPDLHLHTDLMSVRNNEYGLTVHFFRKRAENPECASRFTETDCGYEDDYSYRNHEDEEEEHLREY